MFEWRAKLTHFFCISDKESKIENMETKCKQKKLALEEGILEVKPKTFYADLELKFRRVPNVTEAVNGRVV